MRVVNLAHGELIVIGAFLGVYLAALLPGVPPWALALPVALVGAAVGWTLQTVLVNRSLEGGNVLVPLMLTFGLGVVLRNTMVAAFGADSRAIDGGTLARAGVNLFGLRVGLYPLLVLALAVALFVGLQQLLRHSEFGRVVRATADAPEIARLMGVKPERVFAQVMALGTAFAMLAGFLLAQRTSFTPFSGAERMLIAFEVVIIGGLGSFWGALGGGVLLGLAQVLGQKWDSNAGSLYVHLVFLLVLLFMPRGLAGERR
jgi:branched-chain amino acid transport system permease protein